MAERLVVDASPLILIGRIDRLDLVTACAESVAVPEAVLDELRAGSHRDDLASRVEKVEWARIASDEPVSGVLAAWNLGRGEEQVLAFADAHSGWETVLDDAAGRRCAMSMRIQIVGTVGLVLRAKVRGVIEEASFVIEALRGAGLYLTDEAAARALALVEELTACRTAADTMRIPACCCCTEANPWTRNRQWNKASVRRGVAQPG